MSDRFEHGGSRHDKHDKHDSDQDRVGSRHNRHHSSPRSRRSRSASPLSKDWKRSTGRDRADRPYGGSGGQERRNPRNGAQLPPRPTARDTENDPSVHANSFAEYRRLKRQKMADNKEWLIWGRSPSPIDEPLLRADDEVQAEQPTDGKREPDIDPAEEEIDQEELRIFIKWLEMFKAEMTEQEEKRKKEEEESRPVGPAPPPKARVDDPSSYGINLRPGEGERMAEFARQGQRIPRRGEVGLTSEQIESFEDVGYVMSGSRHSRMNAIRIRKENQVYTAEEKAALAMFNQEEAKRKEQQLTDQFKKLIQETIGEAGGSAGAAGGQDGGGQDTTGS
eukprot:jgi/Ulvmu1/12550/UM090_0037.1